MSKPQRFTDEPAYVLHRYDWSETSLILDVFTRQHGRQVLVAKGAKRPTSQLRPVLLPLQPLLLAWSGSGEVHTLKTAHWRGGHVMPVGEALLAGTYFNEMLMRLLARGDAHPPLFDGYAQAVARLAQRGSPDAAVLRAFELLLLREAGLLPDLRADGSSLQALAPAARYFLTPEGGLRAAEPTDRAALPGRQFLDLQHALDQRHDLDPLVAACATCGPGLQTQLRHLLHYHCGVQAFKTRQILREVQALGLRI